MRLRFLIAVEYFWGNLGANKYFHKSPMVETKNSDDTNNITVIKIKKKN